MKRLLLAAICLASPQAEARLRAGAAATGITPLEWPVRVIGNFQLLPRLTLRAGYQAMFTTGMATAVGNFQTDLDVVRFGPSTINTRDEVIYHGPVAGIMWER